jgi:hypothetical protein
MVGDATRLGLNITEQVPACIAALAGWSRLLRGERGD